jgi:hypothetical protein
MKSLSACYLYTFVDTAYLNGRGAAPDANLVIISRLLGDSSRRVGNSGH